MRLTSIEARELFSFDELQLNDLPRTLVVVGPNGAGKTNLVRLLEIVRAAIERAASYSQDAYWILARLAASRRFGAASANISSIRFGITLTEPWELELLTSFVRAAIFSSIVQDAPSNADTSGVRDWTREHVRESALAPLHHGAIVVELVEGSTGPWTTGYEFDVDGDRFRWVLDGVPSAGALIRAADVGRTDLSTFPVATKLDLDEKRVPKHPFALANLLPPPGEGRMLVIDSGSGTGTELVRDFITRADIPVEQAQRHTYSVVHVLRVVLDRGVMLLGDLRQPPRLEYEIEEAGFDPSPADGSRIPLRLFRLKNSHSALARGQYAQIRELFRRLTGLTFDVALVDTPPGQTDQPASKLLVSVLVEQDGYDLPIEFAGAGIWEALLLSATLPGSGGLVGVLDEPARNLHPTLQRRLLTEMRQAPGQFILTTHSPYLVPAGQDRDLVGIVRLAVKNGATCVSRFAKTGPADSARLRKVLAESADARALLFARGVVLVEGGTELGALPEWFGKSRTAEKVGAPDALNVSIFSVDGDGGFSTFVALLHELGVPWAIVCDGSVFRFDMGTRQIFNQVLSGGVDDVDLRDSVNRAAAGTTFEEVRDLGERRGIFTLARDWDPAAESIEAYMEEVAPGLLAEAAKIVGSSKPRRGRHVASVTSCPPEVDRLYERLLRRLGVITADADGSADLGNVQTPARAVPR